MKILLILSFVLTAIPAIAQDLILTKGDKTKRFSPSEIIDIRFVDPQCVSCKLSRLTGEIISVTRDSVQFQMGRITRYNEEGKQIESHRVKTSEKDVKLWVAKKHIKRMKSAKCNSLRSRLGMYSVGMGLVSISTIINSEIITDQESSRNLKILAAAEAVVTVLLFVISTQQVKYKTSINFKDWHIE